MKNVKPIEIVSMLVLVLGFVLFCWAIPSILTDIFGCLEGSIFVSIFRVIRIVGLVFGSVLVILLSYAMHRALNARKSEKES